MAFDLYSTRQYLVHHITMETNYGRAPPQFFHRAGGVLLRASELLTGVSLTTILHADDTIVRNTKYDTETIVEASQRGRLTSSNCALLRPPDRKVKKRPISVSDTPLAPTHVTLSPLASPTLSLSSSIYPCTNPTKPRG